MSKQYGDYVTLSPEASDEEIEKAKSQVLGRLMHTAKELGKTFNPGEYIVKTGFYFFEGGHKKTTVGLKGDMV